MDVFEFKSLAEYLSAIYIQKKDKNKGYSVAVMAKFFGFNATVLWRFMKGLRVPTEVQALVIAEKMKLEGASREYCIALIHSKDSIAKIVELQNQKKSEVLSADRFRAISDWYHLPILEMLRSLQEATFSYSRAAQELGIEERDVKAAIDRLKRLGLITYKEGKFHLTHERMIIHEPGINLAIQEFYRQTLKKGTDTFGKGDSQKKFIGNETLSIDESLIPEAKRILDEAFHRLVELAQKSPQKKLSVMSVNILMFPILNEINISAHGDNNEKIS